MTYTLFFAVVLSSILIVILCMGDPKRRRAARNGGAGRGKDRSGEHDVRLRRILATSASLPGIYLGLAGDASAFLTWLGACGVVGWLLTLALGFRRESGITPRR
jgi:hypothetical protein